MLLSNAALLLSQQSVIQRLIYTVSQFIRQWGASLPDKSLLFFFLVNSWTNPGNSLSSCNELSHSNMLKWVKILPLCIWVKSNIDFFVAFRSFRALTGTEMVSWRLFWFGFSFLCFFVLVYLSKEVTCKCP